MCQPRYSLQPAAALGLLAVRRHRAACFRLSFSTLTLSRVRRLSRLSPEGEPRLDRSKVTWRIAHQALDYPTAALFCMSHEGQAAPG